MFPAEVLRTLGTSNQKSQEAHAELVRALARRGILEPFTLPDCSTKEKAQAYIGFDTAKARPAKERFLREVIPLRDEQSRARQAAY